MRWSAQRARRPLYPQILPRRRIATQSLAATEPELGDSNAHHGRRLNSKAGKAPWTDRAQRPILGALRHLGTLAYPEPCLSSDCRSRSPGPLRDSCAGAPLTPEPIRASAAHTVMRLSHGFCLVRHARQSPIQASALPAGLGASPPGPAPLCDACALVA
jgi:hypothetical protein